MFLLGKLRNYFVFYYNKLRNYFVFLRKLRFVFLFTTKNTPRTPPHTPTHQNFSKNPAKFSKKHKKSAHNRPNPATTLKSLKVFFGWREASEGKASLEGPDSLFFWLVGWSWWWLSCRNLRFRRTYCFS